MANFIIRNSTEPIKNLMKTSFYILTFLALATLFLLPACSGDDPSAEEIFLEKLAGTWAPGNVSVDNLVVNGAFDGFSITFSKDKTFTTTKGNNPIWPASGAFTLNAQSTADPGFDLMRSDGVEVQVTTLSAQSLVLKFQYIDPNGRIKSVSGLYTFELQK
jgi:hypothetical protein